MGAHLPLGDALLRRYGRSRSSRDTRISRRHSGTCTSRHGRWNRPSGSWRSLSPAKTVETLWRRDGWSLTVNRNGIRWLEAPTGLRLLNQLLVDLRHRALGLGQAGDHLSTVVACPSCGFLVPDSTGAPGLVDGRCESPYRRLRGNKPPTQIAVAPPRWAAAPIHCCGDS